MINFKKINKEQKGSLLFEILIVISLIAIILSVGSNAVFLGMRSNKVSAERDIANSLASMALESVRGIVEENWQNIYGLIKNSQHYHVSEAEGKWVLVEGDEHITINSELYTRYLTIENVSRDEVTRDITINYSENNNDPSTQKVTSVVSWADGNSITVYQYFFRWRNKVCNQTEWAIAEPGNEVKDCSTNTYDQKESSVDASGGFLKLQGSPVSGVLSSSVFDTVNSSSVGYNSIMWKGSLAGEGKVRFQFAASQSSSGPWNFYGGNTCSSGDWFDSLGPNNPIEIKEGIGCFGEWNGKRYFRYKVQICSRDCLEVGLGNPEIDSIIINWSL